MESLRELRAHGRLVLGTLLPERRSHQEQRRQREEVRHDVGEELCNVRLRPNRAPPSGGATSVTVE